MRRPVPLSVFLVSLLWMMVQPQGLGLAKGVSVDIPTIRNAKTDRFEWTLPLLRSTAHTLIVQSCNALNICSANESLTVPSRPAPSRLAAQNATTRADPGSSSFCARPCTRLLLTDRLKTTISNRRAANTTEWQRISSFITTYFPNSGDYIDNTTLSGVLSTARAGSTFTVASASGFPCTGSTFQVRIDLELLTVSCSGTTFTVVSRGNSYGFGTLGAQNHAIGAEVWQWAPVYACGDGSMMLAMMSHIGAGSGYQERARACFGQLMLNYSPISGRHNLNMIRGGWWAIAVTYDWIRDALSENEVRVYGAILAENARWHMDNLKYCNPNDCQTRQTQFESAITANIGNGQIRGILAMAAAVAGDEVTAQDTWDDAYAHYNDYLIPALTSGTFSGGVTAEGSEYIQEVWSQTPLILNLVESAIGEDSWSRAGTWPLNFTKWMLYGTQPSGRRYSASFTYAMMDLGSTTAMVSGGAGGPNTFSVGEFVNITTAGGGASKGIWGALVIDSVTTTDVLPDPAFHVPSSVDIGGYIRIAPLAAADGFIQGEYRIESIVGGKWRLHISAGNANASTLWWRVPAEAYKTVIMNISGNRWTLRDPAPWKVTNGRVTVIPSIYSQGDAETYNNHDDYVILSNTTYGQMPVMDRLASSNPVYASYMKHHIDQTSSRAQNNVILWALMYYNTSLTAVDYTTASLPTIHSTPNAPAVGQIIGMSDWTKLASWSSFWVGAEIASGFDHFTHWANHYCIKRKGVWLSCAIKGYGSVGLRAPTPHYNDQGQGPGPAPFLGWRYHNTIAMNNHGTYFYSNATTFPVTGPARLTRSDVQTTHAYGRGNAGDHYYFSNNTARIFQRDWLYIKPDLWAFMDYVTYSAASTSPTTWFLQLTGKPSESSQRITSTYSTQKLVQDVLLPTSASFTEISHNAEDAYLRGYRVEVRSGVSARTEYFCSPMQAMDSGDTPATATTLTTTNACVFQMGAIANNPSCTAGCVIGFVKGATPTLPIEYTYTDGPTAHFLYGFAPTTAYHITRAGSIVTIVAATGSGDTTSSLTGRLGVP